MKKEWILLLIAGVVCLSGCSAYEKGGYQSGNGPTVEVVTPTQTEAEGPTLSSKAELEETIAPLEVETQEKNAWNPEIVIGSDIHYLAKELTDFGTAFMDMVNRGDGKMPHYVWEITDAFLEQVIDKNPQALILSGDLTLEGEYVSHEALAQRLKKVEDAGIPVYVIPGNHDINNSKAASFKGADKIPAMKTSPEDFVSIYEEFGYSEAISRDPQSLSYMAELQDGTRLLMLDSCQYEDGAVVGGMIRSETYDWLEQVLDEAWYEDCQVIAVAHHNLMDESRIYEEDCTIEHAEELEELLSGYGVQLFLSGHLHVQHYKTSEDYQMDEIVTTSLTTSPCLYGVLKYFDTDDFTYHTEKVDVSSWAMEKNNPDVNLQEFETYADEFLQKVFYDEAYESLNGYELSLEQKAEMAELYAILNVYAVAGKAYTIGQGAMEFPAYEWWQEYSRTDILAMYLNEILEDAVCDYNVFTRPLQEPLDQESLDQES